MFSCLYFILLFYFFFNFDINPSQLEIYKNNNEMSYERI